MLDSNAMDEMCRLVREARDTPALRFQQTRLVPRGEMYRVTEVERDPTTGQAFQRVLLNPVDAPTIRAAILPTLHPVFGKMPPGLE